MTLVPRSARLVAWGGAVLTGHASPDDAVDHIVGDDHPHRVAGLPGEDAPVGLALAIGRLRTLGVGGLRLALPAPGDACGLPGPPEFNAVAVEAGEAALTRGGEPLGLVPAVTQVAGRDSVLWHVHHVAFAAAAGDSLADAERLLTETMRDVTARLVTLDVARGGPDVERRLAELRRTDPADTKPPPLAPNYPPSARRILSLALRLQAIAELAAADSGAAVSAGEMQARTALLRELDPVTRRAVMAAANAPLEPR
jgi:hypothetical protein